MSAGDRSALFQWLEVVLFSLFWTRSQAQSVFHIYQTLANTSQAPVPFGFLLTRPLAVINWFVLRWKAESDREWKHGNKSNVGMSAVHVLCIRKMIIICAEWPFEFVCYTLLYACCMLGFDFLHVERSWRPCWKLWCFLCYSFKYIGSSRGLLSFLITLSLHFFIFFWIIVF